MRNQTFDFRNQLECLECIKGPVAYANWNALQCPRLRRRATPQRGPVAYANETSGVLSGLFSLSSHSCCVPLSNSPCANTTLNMVHTYSRVPFSSFQACRIPYIWRFCRRIREVFGASGQKNL
eukprot:sb/3475844/